MVTAVQFGAGNIGRGFLGQLFGESGFEVVFVDVVAAVVDKLNADHRYTITIAAEPEECTEITNVRGVNGRDVVVVAEEIVRCEIAATAVGVNVLGSIADPIALGIKHRRVARPDDTLNIIVCENMQDAAGHLKNLVRQKLSREDCEWMDAQIGFAQAVVGRMVPVRTSEERAIDPLGVTVEAYKTLPIDKDALRGELPKVIGIHPERNFHAYIDRKLFAHNAGHAVSAYHGFLRGHTFIWECMEDDFVHETTRSAMVETGEALIRRYGLDADEHWAHVDDLLSRFANKRLGDTVARVGADPIRKLGREDRLTGGALLCIEEGINPVNLANAIAAGLRFSPSRDSSAPMIQRLIVEHGVGVAFEQICGVSSHSELGELVLAAYDEIISYVR